VINLKSITIKNINEKLYQEFKAEAVRRGMRISDAINEAIAEWIRKRKYERTKPKKDKLWDIINNPMDLGVETDASKVDEELYGEE